MWYLEPLCLPPHPAVFAASSATRGSSAVNSSNGGSSHGGSDGRTESGALIQEYGTSITSESSSDRTFSATSSSAGAYSAAQPKETRLWRKQQTGSKKKDSSLLDKVT
ncbi:hypothetical protein B0T24DRAFT_588117 [Lasiosphaeria ovina]|uniref:Uncharacterized protein n=1 Tax=Lasiosphaeria ovina TaxID=92902 RepID=A0AAE0NKX7_9PEZI|nr:hypothetical protein B0T24DRAFT_588117 [Lasiosphaeria ovina]